ncbi:MAG TPA: hypothetical protein VKB81_04175 [Nitrospira sp.]|nr:hypothetical protein [Nitrospira sp.]
MMLGIVPLVLILAGLRSVLSAVQAHDPSMYSVEGEMYAAHALMFSSGGFVGLFGCYRMCQADSGWKWALVPVAMIIFAVIVPTVELGHHGTPFQRAYLSTQKRLNIFASRSTQLAREQGQFTCDTSADLSPTSLFVREGQALPYVIQCVPDAIGPALGTPPQQPGTLLFAVSQDRKQAWFTATVLARAPGPHSTWLMEQGQLFVIAVHL